MALCFCLLHSKSTFNTSSSTGSRNTGDMHTKMTTKSRREQLDPKQDYYRYFLYDEPIPTTLLTSSAAIFPILCAVFSNILVHSFCPTLHNTPSIRLKSTDVSTSHPIPSHPLPLLPFLSGTYC